MSYVEGMCGGGGEGKEGGRERRERGTFAFVLTCVMTPS